MLENTHDKDETTQLSSSQEEGLERILSFIISKDEQIFVLKGHSGTGKTTLVNYLIKNLDGFIKSMRAIDDTLSIPKIQLTATTHKAANVLESKTNRYAQTIHSLLELKLSYDFKSGKEFLTCTSGYNEVRTNLKNTLIFMDEASMASRELLTHLYKSLDHTTKVIMIGDPYQLSPVNERNSSAFTNGFPEFTLEGVQRQEEGNTILQFGEQMRHTVETGKFYPIQFDNTNLIHLEGPDFQKIIDEHFSDYQHGLNNRILTWTNGRVLEYNEYVRSLFTDEEIPQEGEIYISNNAVVTGSTIALRNNEQVEIVNAESTLFHDLDAFEVRVKLLSGKEIIVHTPQNQEHYKMYLKQLAREAKANNSWFDYFQVKEGFADLRPCYAQTCHKAQGSTFDNVYIDLYDLGRCRNPNDLARMLYVAGTRAKDKIYFTDNLPRKYGGTA